MNQSDIYSVLLAGGCFAGAMLTYGTFLLLRAVLAMRAQDRAWQTEVRRMTAYVERARGRELLTEQNKQWLETVTSDL